MRLQVRHRALSVLAGLAGVLLTLQKHLGVKLYIIQLGKKTVTAITDRFRLMNCF